MHIAFRANHKREVKNFYVDATRASGLGAGFPTYRRPDESIYNAAVYDPWGNTVEVVYYRHTPDRSASGTHVNTSGTTSGTKSTNPSSATVNSASADRIGRADKLSSKEKLGMPGAASGSKLNVNGGGSKRSSRHSRTAAPGTKSSSSLGAAGMSRVQPGNQPPVKPLSKHGFLDTMVDVATTAAAACFAWKNGQTNPNANAPNQRRDGRRNGGGSDIMRLLDLLPRNRSNPSMQQRPGSGMYNRPGPPGYWDRPPSGAYDGARSRQSLNSRASRDGYDTRSWYGRAPPPPRNARSTNDFFDQRASGYGAPPPRVPQTYDARPPSRGSRRSYFRF